MLRFWHSMPSHSSTGVPPSACLGSAVNVASSRPAWAPSSPCSCSDAPCSTPAHHCLVAPSTLMASQLHHSEEAHERKESVRKRACFPLSGGQTCVLLLHSYVCRLPSGNVLDFVFLFFDTFFSYVSHVSFYICCIVYFQFPEQPVGLSTGYYVYITYWIFLFCELLTYICCRNFLQV